MRASASELHNLATTLEQEGKLPEALEAYQAAQDLNPGSSYLAYNIGVTLRKLKRFDEAIQAFDRAVATKSDFAMAHFMQANCMLQLGDLHAGFRQMEWRKECPTYDEPRYGLPRQWAGQSLRGKTLFVYPELYHGDMLQFCRYALFAEQIGAKVMLAAPVGMHAVLRTMSPTITLLPADATPSDYDYASALMSLPAAFGTTLQNVPAGVYLHADPMRVDRWRKRIGTQGFRIGVAWQGSAQALLRSYPLPALRPLGSIPGVRLISLQKGAGLEQLLDLPQGMSVEVLGDEFDPGPDLFVDTAAAMMCCDLFVTADTSVAHLAGAMGVRTWIALPHLGDWRWLEGRADTPWYPTTTLYRQPAEGDWDAVFASMRDDLLEQLAPA